MVREHHIAVLLINNISVLCMELYVSGGSHTQYTYMIGPRAQLCGAPGPYKYFFYGWTHGFCLDHPLS